MQAEGIIKFNCEWLKDESLPKEILKDIIFWRNKLYELNLIGVYEDGIGYGNISIRHEQNKFIISGSQTGHIGIATEKEFTLVEDYDFNNNYIQCRGPVQASSESLTHAAIYEASPKINGVIHIHNLQAWEKYKNKLPTTNENIEYGTPEMATEIFRLFRETNAIEEKIIIMGGHKEGIIVFGENLEEAGDKLKILL